MADLSQARLRELFNYDPETGIFTRHHSLKGTGKDDAVGSIKKNFGYLLIGVDNKRYRAHRLAWLYHFGEWPENEIDHINGDPGDNRIANLREATRVENLVNKRKSSLNTSGYKGVHYASHAKRFRANIGKGGVTKFLGYFDTAEEAALAYDAAAKTFHGSFARLNFSGQA